MLMDFIVFQIDIDIERYAPPVDMVDRGNFQKSDL